MMPNRKAANATILIIDDDVASRKALAEVLTDEGYGVATASDGADALAYLREGHRPELILLDLMMPGVDGWDFRAQQKRDESIRAIPVIAISAAGKLMDADHTLRKPFNIETLLNLIKTVLEPAAS